MASGRGRPSRPTDPPSGVAESAGRGLDSAWAPRGGPRTGCHPCALTWVQDGLDDVPVPPLGLHALQLLGLVPLAALLLLLLPGVLRGADGGSAEAWGSAPPTRPRGPPPGSGLPFS